MKKNKIHLDFSGYWTDADRRMMPNFPGVFCIYACFYDRATHKVRPRRVLYIGESVAVRDRLLDRADRARWLRQLAPGENLCYSYAPAILDRKRAQQILTSLHRPPANFEAGSQLVTELREAEDEQQGTELLLSGEIYLLRSPVQAEAERSSA